MSAPGLSVILTHQAPALVARMLERWRDWVSLDDVLLAFGGRRGHFEEIAHPHKVFIDDPRLRTRDHQRELQSYTAIYRQAGAWLRERGHESVFLLEYDQVPLRRDFLACFQQRLEDERADVLAGMLRRVDGTNYAHYLFHAQDERFHAFWERVSCREDRSVVLSMLGTGSYWRREAFLAVGQWDEPMPMYHELYIPTLAHHMGFRLRDLAEQNQWVRPDPLPPGQLQAAIAAKAWTAHPLKHWFV